MRKVRRFCSYRNRPIRGFDQGSEPKVAISIPVNYILVDIYQYHVTLVQHVTHIA